MAGHSQRKQEDAWVAVGCPQGTADVWVLETPSSDKAPVAVGDWTTTQRLPRADKVLVGDWMEMEWLLCGVDKALVVAAGDWTML